MSIVKDFIFMHLPAESIGTDSYGQGQVTRTAMVGIVYIANVAERDEFL